MLMLVKTTCPICHCDTYLQVDAEEYARWQAGELIQVAMPYLDADEREMLISGICPTCWDDMFGDEDEDEEYLPEPDDLDFGFDPYLGDYTWDC